MTSLEAGSVHGTVPNDILSMNVSLNLQKLLLHGPLRCTATGDSRGWTALMTLTSLLHLELVSVDHRCQVFEQFSTMAQLTHLRFESVSKHLDCSRLDQYLLHLSTLTNLCTLKCSFLRPMIDRGKAPDTVPCGDALKAAVAQCPNMYVNVNMDFVLYSIQENLDKRNACNCLT